MSEVQIALAIVLGLRKAARIGLTVAGAVVGVWLLFTVFGNTALCGALAAVFALGCLGAVSEVIEEWRSEMTDIRHTYWAQVSSLRIVAEATR